MTHSMQPGRRQPAPRRFASAFALIALLLAACAPTTAPSQPGPSSSALAEVPRAPKTLTIAVLAEPQSLHQDLSPGTTTSGNRQVHLITHNYLVVRDGNMKRVPQLAQELISVDRGTWRVNPDGTMDTTWKIRPNVKWHDGAPFTSADLLFAFTVYKDREIPANISASVRAMASAEAPDPITFVVHWSTIFADADGAIGLIPMPRHLLEDTYRNDKANFLNSPLLGPEFVGLGAYKLVKWDQGLQMEFARFDDYFLGRPPLDTVILKFLGDSNTMVASILAGTTDVLLPQGVDVEIAAEVRQRWEGTGNQVTIAPSGSLRYLQIQHRVEYSRPRNGFTVRTVRQAFYNATDRQAVADISTVGTAPISDGWFPPSHDLYPTLRDGIPQFPYDLALAQQRLSQAGWVRNTEGDLIHQPDGERFDIELRTSPGAGAEKRLAPIADGWKGVGATATLNIVPAALSTNAEYRTTLPGAGITGNVIDMFHSDALDSRQIASPANRWTGTNRSGYASPAVDAIYDKLIITIAPAERTALHRALLQEAMGDVAIIPLYFEVAPTLMLKGVHGITGYGRATDQLQIPCHQGQSESRGHGQVNRVRAAEPLIGRKAGSLLRKRVVKIDKAN
ncbi:MAG: bac 5 protein [Chloroflexi bacterium]|nr:bac 5 protein [Chloroflexota bacterium]